jgi:hypothetical protein
LDFGFFLGGGVRDFVNFEFLSKNRRQSLPLRYSGVDCCNQPGG